jgi:hypothetical protein
VCKNRVERGAGCEDKGVDRQAECES